LSVAEMAAEDRARRLIELGNLGIMAGRAGDSIDYYRRAVAALPTQAPAFAHPVFLGISGADRMVRVYRDALAASRHFDATHSHLASGKPPGALIGSPMPLCESRLTDLVGDVPYRDYRMTLQVAVSPAGKVTDVDVVDSNAPSAFNRLVSRLYRAARFRPRMASGKSTADVVRVEQRFDETSPAGRKAAFPTARIGTMHGCFAMAQLD